MNAPLAETPAHIRAAPQVAPLSGRRIHRCRFCAGALSIPFCDLGLQPLANSFVPRDARLRPDPVFPLEARACERCHLVQLAYIADAQHIFSEYAYFSSFSSGWMAHAAAFASAASQRLGLDRRSWVVEVASNDGYLLKNFVAAGIPSLGIEPAANVAAAARAIGVATEVRFFGLATARELVADHGHADLVVANNVLAHVPDLNDFVAGLAHLAGPRGVVSIESPHLMRLIEGVQFDTIYHEHYAYWTLATMEAVLAAHGLRVYDVERLPTHGGSLRVWARAGREAVADPTPGCLAVRAEESLAGVRGPGFYTGFEPRVRHVLKLARDLLDAHRHSGQPLAAYGAAAKGNTFLNALGATPAEVCCVADLNPVKQGRLLPGSRIPVVSPRDLLDLQPRTVLILPWNIADEVAREMAAIGRWGGRFAVAIPRLRLFLPEAR